MMALVVMSSSHMLTIRTDKGHWKPFCKRTGWDSLWMTWLVARPQQQIWTRSWCTYHTSHFSSFTVTQYCKCCCNIPVTMKSPWGNINSAIQEKKHPLHFIMEIQQFKISIYNANTHLLFTTLCLCHYQNSVTLLAFNCGRNVTDIPWKYFIKYSKII